MNGENIVRDVAVRISAGMVFQAAGPATVNARLPALSLSWQLYGM